MADHVSQSLRSQIMGSIRSKHTSPEIMVRSLLHKLGYRFRLHVRALPGTPDIVLPRHAKIVMVQGCFWHGHLCKRATLPKSNCDFWKEKITKNKNRDLRNLRDLQALGWDVLQIWQCDLRRANSSVWLEKQLRAFFELRSSPKH